MTKSSVTLELIYKELKAVKKQIGKIEKQMIDVDCVLSASESAAVEQAKMDIKAGKAVSLEDFRKTL